MSKICLLVLTSPPGTTAPARNGGLASTWWWIAASVLACLVWRPSLAAEIAVPEQDAKAKALAIFSEFIKWPTNPEAAVTIGILGDDPFGDSLEKLHVAVKRARRLEELKECQVLFIARSEEPKIGEIIDSLGDASVLTVGETEGFAKDGGVIGFTVVGDKVRFEINTSAARRAGLKIDSRLLRLAVRIFNS